MEKIFCFTYQYTAYKYFYVVAKSEKRAVALLEEDMGNAFKEEESWHDEKYLGCEEVN